MQMINLFTFLNQRSHLSAFILLFQTVVIVDLTDSQVYTHQLFPTGLNATIMQMLPTSNSQRTTAAQR